MCCLLLHTIVCSLWTDRKRHWRLANVGDSGMTSAYLVCQYLHQFVVIQFTSLSACSDWQVHATLARGVSIRSHAATHRRYKRTISASSLTSCTNSYSPVRMAIVKRWSFRCENKFVALTSGHSSPVADHVTLWRESWVTWSVALCIGGYPSLHLTREACCEQVHINLRYEQCGLSAGERFNTFDPWLYIFSLDAR